MRFAFIALSFIATVAQGAEIAANLDPAQTEIHWTLGGSLHTVHGKFNLKNGQIRFDDATGKARGEIVIDAKSGESGNGSRDKRMHKEVLETDKYPDAVFKADKVTGQFQEGESRLQIHGVFRIHGEDHELTMPAVVTRKGDVATVTLHFNIPYVQWGMKDPSNFLLKVDKVVGMDITTVVRLKSPLG